MKEVTVAGGGLAGLALAVALRRRGVPVQVLEAGTYPRHRVCGEFISGVTADTLDFLGIREAFADARCHRSVAWIEGNRTLHRDTLPEPAIGISRYALDHRLQCRLTDLGGVVQTAVRARPVPCEGTVWAAGRRPHSRSLWIGLKAHVRGLPMTADLELHLGRNGYVGLAGIEDGWVNVCGLFRLDRALSAGRADMLPSYIEAGGCRALARHLRGAEGRPGSFSAVAGLDFRRVPALPGVLCLGDAARMIPPFTGNGMSMALQAAETACEHVILWAGGHNPWPTTVDRVRYDLDRRFRRRLAAAAVMHPVVLGRAGQSMLGALSRSHLLPFQSLLSLVR